jgi:1-acyl-sn-glycerol-3-phosphate acyltransferase
VTNPAEATPDLPPAKKPNPGKTWLYHVAGVIVRPFMHLVGNYKWKGLENLPAEGGIIVAANHASNVDPLTLAHYLFSANRPARVLAKDSLFKIPVVRYFLKNLDMIPVYRGTTRAAESVQAAGSLLKDGYCIAVFPEGTLTKDPFGWPMQARTGVARMALMSQAPVIPVGQWGQLGLWPRGKKFVTLFPRQTVTVRAGAPVDLSDLYGRELDSVVLREATDRIMRAITQIVAEERGEPAPAEFYNPRAQ